MLRQVSKQVLEDIDTYCEKTYDDGNRNHLGASLIAHDCERYLWYVFRWCFHKVFSGRQQRLFNRGHREEARFIEWLEGCGFEVFSHDFENNVLYHVPATNDYILESKIEHVEYNLGDIVDGCVNVSNLNNHIEMAKASGLKIPQFRISGVNGHLGGSLDGKIRFPKRYGIEELCLTEFKTNGTGSGFTNLKKNGMPVEKPQHYGQTSLYGYKMGLNYCLYLNINKNDDDIHCELVKLDHDLGQRLELKAEKIIYSEKAPNRLSESPTYFKCTYCDMKDICHNGMLSEKNCRSCCQAVPIHEAQWGCKVYNEIIPIDVIKIGCENWQDINHV